MIAVFTHGRVYMPTNISTEVMIGHQLKHFYTKSIAYMWVFFKPTKNSRLTTFPLAVDEFAFLVTNVFFAARRLLTILQSLRFYL